MGQVMVDTRGIIESDVPARLDWLPWGRFHTLIVFALGITWILDGLEVTLAGSLRRDDAGPAGRRAAATKASIQEPSP